MSWRGHSLAAAALLAATALLAPAASAAPSSAPEEGRAGGQPECHPIKTDPRFRGGVPAPNEVLGFRLGAQAVTVDESNRFLTAVAEQSPRVVSGTLATSWEGRPLRYAIAGKPSNVTPKGLARVREAASKLRDPHTSDDAVRKLARKTPPILWVAGNVHGNEESGADAALKTLYHLAGRNDCAAERILHNALVVILPIQNPDGRAADTRQNAYGFDMNRDWFARTQPETDGKLAMLRKYPPAVFIDAHEMGGTGYFFPPNADPIYHEIAGTSLDWMATYGDAMAQEFRRQGIDFFQREAYDLFYQGYGDTVPSTGFLAAGMTFEKGGESPISVRTREQYVTQWTTLSTAADHPQRLLSEWHASYVEAYEQGKKGSLEPNEVINPDNEVVREVPDRKVRNYFLRADNPSKARQVRTIVRRLQRMDVSVYQLTEPLEVTDYKPYGRSERATTLPSGTYWIPMAQAQKHWIQAMLNEDTYTPFPYFYDVTAWSLPLLGDVAGGSSGAQLDPPAREISQLPEPETPDMPAELPEVGLLKLSPEGTESAGWLSYRLEQEWNIEHRDLTPADVAAGDLGGVDVLLAPNGPADEAYEALGEDGRQALRAWVNDGGRYVGWQGGATLAARVGVTTATLEEPTSDVPGSLFHVQVDSGSPLATGVGEHGWQFYAYDAVMRASDASHVVASYPEPGSPDWFVSGFQQGAEELGGTAALISEPVGDGRAVISASALNFRAYTDGAARFVRNAIVAPALGGPTGASTREAPAAGSPERADQERAARRAAAALPEVHQPIRVSVQPGAAERVAELLRGFGADWVTQRSPDRVSFVVRNPQGLHADQHPWARQLPGALERAGVRPIAVDLP